MWVFTKVGAVSVTRVPMDKADKRFTLGRRSYQLRGRCRDQLEAIIANYCGSVNPSPIQERPEADYQFRFYVTNHDLKAILLNVVDDLDYGNFKDAATKEGGYGGLLMGVWNTFYNWATVRQYEPDSDIDQLVDDHSPWGLGWGGMDLEDGVPMHDLDSEAEEMEDASDGE